MNPTLLVLGVAIVCASAGVVIGGWAGSRGREEAERQGYETGWTDRGRNLWSPPGGLTIPEPSLNELTIGLDAEAAERATRGWRMRQSTNVPVRK